MAYEKTIWKNREVERPRTFEKIENPDGTITLVPAEGNIIEPGTPLIAENMNKIEQGIQDAHDEIDEHKADYTQHPYYAGNTSSKGTGILVITLPIIYPNWDAIPVGACFSFKNIYNNQTIASGIKLALSGLEGEKPILKSNGNLFTTLTKDAIYTVRWNGVNFILQGEGGEYGNVTPDDVIKGVTFGTEEGLKTGTLELTGNAAAADVLSGKTFYSTNPKSKQTGTMPNRGAVTHTITTQGGSYTIPAGYHNGSGKVTANFANLVAENIKKGVNIGGVVGTMVQGGSEKVKLPGSGILICSASYPDSSSASGYVDITIPKPSFTVSSAAARVTVVGYSYMGGNVLSFSGTFHLTYNLVPNDQGLTYSPVSASYLGTHYIENVTTSGENVIVRVRSSGIPVGGSAGNNNTSYSRCTDIVLIA